ncbi:hypothetical protein AB0L00_21245 [Actinoallomurus sp. NPDC052308]|uniref:hypothetical protein n=1 Tax=Actinoallomurus sp. NPDC052308 TaxID=3155530 RepID=UPI0034295FEE
MADAWLPGAGRLHTAHDGGSPKGGAPRAVWHTSETDPRRISARSVAQRLEQEGRSAHLVWNPWTGEIVQMVPATRAAKLLPDEVGREGRACFQIVVVGFAREPFTTGPLTGLERIVGWLDGWHVPRRWPAGPPLPRPEAYDAVRRRRPWARGGYYGASQVPGSISSDPGRIDTQKITGPDAPVGIPRPRVAPGEETAPADPDALLSRRLHAPDRIEPPGPAHAPANSRS